MRIHFLLYFVFISFISVAQDKAPAKFGKISAADFSNKVYSVDSNANAVVIADVGSSQIVGNSKGWFSLEFKHFRRVHILNKNGYGEANVEIPLYVSNNSEENLDDLKAYTYNIENGKVVETKLEKGSIFKDKPSKNWEIRKFTFPGIKEGSIIEYQYTVTSDFLFNLQPWSFQGGSPVLWSEYNLRIPEFLGYVFLSQGYRQFDVNDRKSSNERYNIRDTRGTGATENYTLPASVTDYHWVMKNVPALKAEPFTSTLSNHISRITFQLSEFRYPLTYRKIMGSWQDVAKQLTDDEDFGASLYKNNNWIGEYIDPVIKGENDPLVKAQKVYAFVRDHYTCTSHYGKYLSESLKNIAKKRNGSVADINLLLIAMLNYADVKTKPVILSTRDNGYAYELYPVMERINYVVAQANIGDKQYLLDASEPRLGFGKLTPECYNGPARVIDELGTLLPLYSDSLMERKLSSVLINTDEKGNVKGTIQSVLGYYESLETRNKIKENGRDNFFKEIQKSFGQETELENKTVDSLDNFEMPVTIKYDFKFEPDDQNTIYINPFFGEAYKTNPFKSAERFYPVEMPYASDETVVFTLIIPEGYVVDELPKSIRMALNEQGDGKFEYLISETGGTISMRSRLTLKRAYYQAEEYELLREFFNQVVKKEAEQIVLKKKK